MNFKKSLTERTGKSLGSASGSSESSAGWSTLVGIVGVSGVISSGLGKLGHSRDHGTCSPLQVRQTGLAFGHFSPGWVSGQVGQRGRLWHSLNECPKRKHLVHWRGAGDGGWEGSQGCLRPYMIRPWIRR